MLRNGPLASTPPPARAAATIRTPSASSPAPGRAFCGVCGSIAARTIPHVTAPPSLATPWVDTGCLIRPPWTIAVSCTALYRPHSIACRRDLRSLLGSPRPARSFALAEIIADQRANRRHRLIFVRPVDLEHHLRPPAGGEHHHAHDALRVDF